MRDDGLKTPEEQGLLFVCNRCDGTGRVLQGDEVVFSVQLVNFLNGGYLPPIPMKAQPGDPCPICQGRGKLGAVDEFQESSGG